MQTFNYKEPSAPISDIDRLVQALREAKEALANAKAAVLVLEGKILALSDTPEEGTAKNVTEFFVVTTTGKLTRKLDVLAWQNVRGAIPEELWPVTSKLVIDLKKLRALESANPMMFKLAAKAIETKPAKATVKVEVLK